MPNMKHLHLSNEEIIFWVTILTAWATIIGLLYTALSFRLKSGIQIRGTFDLVSSSASCQDPYIKSITLENLKDKAVVIYEISLRLASNCYLVLETLERDPLILKPFEVYTAQYDPVDFYSMNMKTLDLESMLMVERMYKIRIVLSTGEGLYHVKRPIQIRRAYELFFQNYLTAIAKPIRLTHKGRAYGRRAVYLLELVDSKGEEACIPIYPEDYKANRFIDFSLTHESLISRESLERYLEDKQQEGLLRCTGLNVIDLQARRKAIYVDYSQKPIIVKPMSKLTYEVIGFVYRLAIKVKNSSRNQPALTRIILNSTFYRKLFPNVRRLWRFR